MTKIYSKSLENELVLRILRLRHFHVRDRFSFWNPWNQESDVADVLPIPFYDIFLNCRALSRVPGGLSSPHSCFLFESKSPT